MIRTNHQKISPAMKRAMAHPDKPGAGAAKRRGEGLSKGEKFKVVMHEFGRGTLRSGGSGKEVVDPKQAIAIAFSEARKAYKKK